MFGQDAAAAACGVSQPKAAGVSLPPVAAGAPAGPAIAFPMKDAYSPAVNSRAPITGLTAWPARRRLPDRYYGLKGLKGGGGSPLRGLGYSFDPFYDPTLDPVYVSGGSPNQYPTYDYPQIYGPVRSQGGEIPPAGSDLLSRILAGIQGILPGVPAVISAAEGNPYYNPAGLRTGGGNIVTVPQTGAGNTGGQIGSQAGAALGNVGQTFANIVAQHPYLTLAAGAGLVLLFMNPPKRGR